MDEIFIPRTFKEKIISQDREELEKIIIYEALCFA